MTLITQMIIVFTFGLQVQALTQKNVLWVISNPDIDKLQVQFPVKGIYKDCEGNCSCEKLFKENLSDLLTYTESAKINVGTASKSYFSGLSGIKGDVSIKNGLWDFIDSFVTKFIDFGVKKNIFIDTLYDLKALKQRFLMIAVSPDLIELNKLLKEVKDEIIIITGSCITKSSQYLATENQKLFESIKTIYEIPHVVRSILDNCNGLCNNTISRVKKRVIRSNDDEMSYEKLDEDPEPQMEEEVEAPEEEIGGKTNSCSTLTNNLIILLEFLSILLTFI